MSISFFLVRCYTRLLRPLFTRFWNSYAISYLKKQGVCIASSDKLIFYGRSYLNISNKARCSFGDNFVCHSGPTFGIESTKSKITVKANAELTIGKNSGFSSVILECHDCVKIGNYVNIGAGTIIMDTNFHSTDWRHRENRQEDIRNAKTEPIVIDDYVFIGARSIINKGVKIGEKSIIAAGSVVVKSIPANCIAGGNPCKVIKFLD